MANKWYTGLIMNDKESKVSNEQVFRDAYDRLNKKQKEAVDTIEGPVMVIAGPGTGKTQILTLRIANILLKTDTAPESILALTFTESGAKAMRERLGRFVGSTAYRVPIYTFHGFAKRLISEYPEAYPKIIGGAPATDLDKFKLIETILETPDLSLLRPTGSPQFYVKPLLQIISHLKQENVKPDGLAALIVEQETALLDIVQYHEKGAHKGKERSEYTKYVAQVEKQRALLLIYRQYETLLRADNLYDFDDMILETVQALTHNEAVLLDLQERYQYILADEHQDVNGAQNAILSLLTSFHNQPNLFVVGDEKQAIYRFQGASLENFLYFESQFIDTKVIALTNNYRSTQPILDAAHALIAVSDGPLVDYRVPLISASDVVTRPTSFAFTHEALEEDWLVKRVQAELSSGIAAAEIAIIVRSNREVQHFAGRLRQAGIPAQGSAEGDILEHPILRSVITLLRAVSKPADEVLLGELLHSVYFGVTPADIVRVLSARNFVTPLAQLLTDVAILDTLNLDNTEAVLRIMIVLQSTRTATLIQPPHRVLQQMLQDSGLLHHVMVYDPLEGTRVIRRLYDEVESLVLTGEIRDLTELVTLLEGRVSYGLPLNAPYIKLGNDGVQVMTAHKAKGLEFTTVFIPHLTEKSWGTSAHPTYFKVPLLRTAVLTKEANEDERRLLYVAMTRAKQRLFITYAGSNAEGKELLPAAFLAELGATITPEIETQQTEFDPLLVLRGNEYVVPATIKELLRHNLITRGLSATALNNFIKNPWNYFYRTVLRLPEIQTLPLQFGVAMHGVLEYCTKTYTKTGVLPKWNEAVGILKRELGTLPLGSLEGSDLLEKGQEILAIYLEHLVQTLGVSTKEEYRMRVILPLSISGVAEIPLTGSLDRLDLDKNGNLLRVVDYKTGKYKTRNEIEGKTAKADASYRRQLTFYSLLLELYNDERYQSEVGLLSFIEPDSKGRIHEEEFISDASERAELRELITASVESIIAGDFLRDEVALADSDYAHIGSDFMKLLLRQ